MASGSRCAVMMAAMVVVACGSAPRPAPRAAPPRPRPPSASRSIRIATWNIENFGYPKVTSPAMVVALADVVRRYDVVAVQEISDARDRVARRFLDVINERPGPTWDCVVSPRSGRQEDDRASAEQYAFYFDEELVEIIDEGELFPDEAADLFQREPFAVRFRALDDGRTFVLITIHTAPRAAAAEIDALAYVLAWAAEAWPDEPEVVVLGDFNAGCDYATPQRLDECALRGPEYVWIVPDSATTNTSASRHCAYDRIVVTQAAARWFGAESWGVDSDAFDPEALDLSDHWPVWAAISR